MNRRPLRRRIPLSPLRRTPWPEQKPTWREASPARIAAALERATARPAGNWYVVGSSRGIRPGRPYGRTVAGTEIVLWRDADGALRAAPGSCPHLGAPLCDAVVAGGELVCHWHGLRPLDGGFPAWAPYPAHDDGVLVWVRLDHLGGEPAKRPQVPQRPAGGRMVDAVLTAIGACEPEDVVANRLDPWHGSWLHPYSFTDLTVVEETPERLLVSVAFRLTGRLGVPVLAEFAAPGPRTVVMRIVEGEGEGSVVETHATPLRPAGSPRPRTAVVEAVVATSERPGFALAATAAPLLRPLMRRTAARLWRDDLAYAERRGRLRREGRFPGGV